MPEVKDDRIRMNGFIYTPRTARKAHRCDDCGHTIEPGTKYYEEVIGGGGLGSLKFPRRFCESCMRLKQENVR